MGSNYDRFLRLVAKWPVDVVQERMEFGVYLRKLLNSRRPNQNIFPGSLEENTEKLNSLSRLLNNVHGDKYPRVKKVGASGLDAKGLEVIINTKIVDLCKDKEKQ